MCDWDVSCHICLEIVQTRPAENRKPESPKLPWGSHVYHLPRQRLGIHHKELEAAAVKKGIWSTGLYPAAITA